MASAKKAPSLRVASMSNETLIKNAEALGAEISLRVSLLGNGLKQLGVQGLVLHEAGMQRAVVRFPGSYKTYEYNVPVAAAVGDTVKTPTSLTGGPSLAEIVGIGTKGYTGPVKDVVALYKKSN